MELRNNLRELRARHKMTQEELADKVGVTRQTIISIEKGEYTPSALLALKIAVFFGLLFEKVFYIIEKEEKNG
ncbi:TPA: transcriptional regulator [candidate division CPR2 bacterium]|nr:MAG: Transcriptional regulator, XRE family [candidate division CPR2 bacterium GW2011_GWD2_39_7]OGB55622.1 MAG: transcriptional regulator [candidate division CPR2 bacterium GWD1_39_7]OGB72761.1 MAG: transcriptional regulator [candidate division CPR2 bacterium GWD2_39_7]HBG81228.1 transcriptional regulator [candidate division CPR2 bacterium]HCL99760.1 transcriptional regulator [candidate division CPR2 bacterium]